MAEPTDGMRLVFLLGAAVFIVCMAGAFLVGAQ